jgi:hypothetical protein
MGQPVVHFEIIGTNPEAYSEGLCHANLEYATLLPLRISWNVAEIRFMLQPACTATSEAFSAWAQAYADLRAAERAGDSPQHTMELTERVLVSRSALVRERIAAGRFPGVDTVKRLRLDEYLGRAVGESLP